MAGIIVPLFRIVSDPSRFRDGRGVSSGTNAEYRCYGAIREAPAPGPSGVTAPTKHDPGREESVGGGGPGREQVPSSLWLQMRPWRICITRRAPTPRPPPCHFEPVLTLVRNLKKIPHRCAHRIRDDRDMSSGTAAVYRRYGAIRESPLRVRSDRPCM